MTSCDWLEKVKTIIPKLYINPKILYLKVFSRRNFAISIIAWVDPESFVNFDKFFFDGVGGGGGVKRI